MTVGTVRPLSDFMREWQEREAARKASPEYAAELAAQEKRERERAEQEEKAKAEIPAREEAAWKRAVIAAVPVRTAVNAFSSEITPAIQAVQNWLETKSKPGLVLRGGVGCGKTTAAAYAVRHWIGRPVGSWCLGEFGDKGGSYSFDWPASALTSRSQPRPISWLRPDQLVSAVLHSYDEASPKLYKHIVIDDLGRETKADFAEALCEVLDSPEPTVLITTNLTRQQLRDRYDLRLLDRLNDTCIAVDLPGKSMRRQDGGF